MFARIKEWFAKQFATQPTPEALDQVRQEVKKTADAVEGLVQSVAAQKKTVTRRSAAIKNPPKKPAPQPKKPGRPAKSSTARTKRG